MKTKLFGALALLFFVASAGAQAAADVALVTAIDGNVARVIEKGSQPVQNFVKVKQGDVLSLEKGAVLQLVYFDGGRQETWKGSGKLEVARSESKATGLGKPEVRKLPDIMVKQIARTPALDTHGRGGVTRLRAIATPEKAAKIEETYEKLKAEAKADDLTPEFYRLSGLFELRLLDRVEAILAELQSKRGSDAQVKHLVSLYEKALKDVRTAN